MSIATGVWFIAIWAVVGYFKLCDMAKTLTAINNRQARAELRTSADTIWVRDLVGVVKPGSPQRHHVGWVKAIEGDEYIVGFSSGTVVVFSRSDLQYVEALAAGEARAAMGATR